MKRFLPLLIFIIYTFLTGCDAKPPVTEELIRPIPAIKVGETGKISGRNFPGRATATQEVDLAFEVGGRIIERPVNIGDSVKTGDVIARLDPRDFQARVKSTQAELRKTRQNFKRAKKLIKDGFISQSEYDRLESAVDVAEANLAIATKALVDSVITAPFNGRIANLFVENYQTVPQKKLVARLLDTSKIEMVVQIPENLISQVSYVENIRVTYDSFPDVALPATIKEISNEASQTTRTYPVTLIMKQPEAIEILPGMAGRATGTLVMPESSTESVQLIVPINAVFTPDTEKQNYVWVINEETGQVTLRSIKTGRLTQTGIQVIEGLQAGEWIAMAGVHTLREGQKVRIDTSVME